MSRWTELEERLQAKDWAALGHAEVAFDGAVWHYSAGCHLWDPDRVETRLFAGADAIDAALRFPQHCSTAECRLAERDTNTWMVDSQVTYQAFMTRRKLQTVAAGGAGPCCDDRDVVGANVCNLLELAGTLAKKVERRGGELGVWLAAELRAAVVLARPALEAAAFRRGVAATVQRDRTALGWADAQADAETARWEALGGPLLPVRVWYRREPLAGYLWPAGAATSHHVPYRTLAALGGHYELEPGDATDPVAAVLAVLLRDTPVRNAAHAAQLLDVAHAAAGPHLLA